VITNAQEGGDLGQPAGTSSSQAFPAELAPGLPVPLHPLTYLEENGEVVVGRPDIDSYGVFPPDGAALVRQLAAGMPPAEAARWYASTYSENVDMAEFLGTLAELQFTGEMPAAAGRPVRWQRLGRWLFSPAAWACYLIVIAAAAAVMIARPRLAPQTGNMFFTHYVTVLAVTLFLGQFPLILLHESFHMLAGRRLGLRSSLRVGRRLYYLVFETTMDGLVAVPRRRRYLPMLAGMLLDLVVIAVLTLIAAATVRPDGSLPLVGRVCLAFAFTTVLRFAWQFYAYLRTDLYYTAVTAMGCLDLQPAARRILANRIRRLLRRPLADESALHPRDRAVGRWYAWLMLAGYAFSLATLALAVVPVTWRVMAIAFDRFIRGGQSWGQLADSVVFLSLSLAQIIVVLTLVLRSRLRQRKGARAQAAA
jgi:hypothetical protein